MTFDQLITQALQDAGVMAVPGQTPPAEYTTQGQFGLNAIFDAWCGQTAFCWSQIIQTFQMTLPYPSVGYYTLGPSGADFTGVRPSGSGFGNGINNASIILENQSPQFPLGLYLMDSDQYAVVSPGLTGMNIPWGLYNDGSFPNTRLYLVGFPTQANYLQLFSNVQIAQVTNLAATFSMAPGYQLAVQKTLAEQLCVTFGKPISKDLAKQGREARGVIESNNAKTPLLSSDAAGLNPNYKGSGYLYQNRSFN